MWSYLIPVPGTILDRFYAILWVLLNVFLLLLYVVVVLGCLALLCKAIKFLGKLVAANTRVRSASQGIKSWFSDLKTAIYARGLDSGVGNTHRI